MTLSSRIRRLALGALALLVHCTVASRVLADGAGRRWFDGDLRTQVALADDVARRVLANDGPVYYHTGIERFDGQSAVAIDQMALLGLGQVVTAHPELRERYLVAMRAAGDHLADPHQLRYAARRYGESGLVRMDPGEGHAYLGYAALGLGMLRRIDPDTPHAALHDRIVAGLAARMLHSDDGLLDTYPGERWPPDVAAVAGAIGLHDAVTGTDRGDALDRWAARFERCAVDPRTGFLRQRLHGCGQGVPRGSGTAVGAYFLSFVRPALAASLERSLAERGARSFLGFGGLREYAPGHAGWGDTNSGPVLAGVSVGATGFGLGAARAAGDRALFLRLHRTTRLFGVSMPHDGVRSFAAGGALGNALLLAMLTAETP
ncbi:MAG: hypothetical protein R3F59_03850 [Myxococcota bacterium]